MTMKRKTIHIHLNLKSKTQSIMYYISYYYMCYHETWFYLYVSGLPCT